MNSLRSDRSCGSFSTIRWSRHSRRKVPTMRSATALALGAITGVRDPADAKPPYSCVDVDAIDPIPVMNQIARLLAVRRGVEELLPDPGHRWVLGDVEVDQVAAGMLDEEEHVQGLEGQGLHHEQVHGPDRGELVVQEGAPG